MKYYKMKEYFEVTNGIKKVHYNAKTIIVMVSSQKMAKWVLDDLARELEQKGIEHYYNVPNNLIYTKAFAIVAKSIIECNCLNYGRPVYYVDDVDYHKYRYSKEKVAEIKTHFSEYTKEIAFEDIANIVEVGDMLCR